MSTVARCVRSLTRVALFGAGLLVIGTGSGLGPKAVAQTSDAGAQGGAADSESADISAALEDSAAAPVPSIDTDKVVLRWLDKSTARVAEVQVPVGEPVMLGGVQVIARACRRTAPDETPEAAAFLDIGEVTAGSAVPTPVFRGWMFASSPSLSAMEHPVYDVWVVACVDDADDGVGVLPPSPPSDGRPSRPDNASEIRSGGQ